MNFQPASIDAAIVRHHLDSGGSSIGCWQSELGPNHFLQVFLSREPWNDDGRQLIHLSASVRHKRANTVLRLPTDEELSIAWKELVPNGPGYDREFTDDHAHLWEKIG